MANFSNTGSGGIITGGGSDATRAISRNLTQLECSKYPCNIPPKCIGMVKFREGFIASSTVCSSPQKIKDLRQKQGNSYEIKYGTSPNLDDINFLG